VRIFAWWALFTNKNCLDQDFDPDQISLTKKL
jgi:hypothetical protein